MNITLWNSTEEAVGHFLLGGATIFVHSTAIYFCKAISDYQDEKPNEERRLLDIHFKDLMTSQMSFLYYTGFFQFISLFTPAVEFDIEAY